MISEISNKHQKHTKLTRANCGEWGWNEFAITGTGDKSIRDIACAAIEFLPQYKIAFVDVHSDDANGSQAGFISSGSQPYLAYTENSSSVHLNVTKRLTPYQKQALFSDCDAVFVNGNHFKAAKQIVVVDEKMPLQKRLNELTDVRLVILKNSVLSVPDYIPAETGQGSAYSVVSIADKESLLQNIKHCILQHGFLINGLVLSGGKSSRMGTDKGELRYHGITQREHMYSLLKELCAETFISCNEEQAQHIRDLPVMADTFLGLGPLSGILSAFQSNPNVAWLTVACDLPFLHKSDLYRLTVFQNESKMATAYLDAEGKFPEPLIAIWQPKAYPVLLNFLSRGINCPRKILMNSDVELIPSLSATACKNVNTKEDYEEAMTLLQGEA